MSTATPVPETWDLDGDDARDALRTVDASDLLRDTVARLRWADGFSHARATAFQFVLTLIPGTVVLVAIAARLQWSSLNDAILRSVESVAPGPSSQTLHDAFERGVHAGDAGNWTAIGLGGVALLVSGTTAFGQVERAANRIYGVERDRPSVAKYRRALVLMLSAGTLFEAYFATIGLGSGWGSSSSDQAHWWWAVGRWPLGALFLAAAITLIFHASPKRRQPSWSWLMVGTFLAIAGVVLVSMLLAAYLRASSSFGETYGPLAGFLGLLLWSYLASLAVYLGLSFAAQLEAVRAGMPVPQSEAKVEAGEPDTAVVPYGTALHRH